LLVRTGHPAEALSFLKELVTAVPWNTDYRIRYAQARLAANQDVDAARKELIGLATGKEVAYETRLAAAKSMAVSGASGDLGSRELNLIASGQPVNASDASQPFFFAARLKAAESSPAAAKVSLLRAALEDRPSGDAARVPLLKAAMETGDYHLAIAVMKPFLQNSALDRAFNTQSSEEDEDLQQQPTGGDDTVRGLAKLTSKERAEVSRDLGVAFEKTDALDQALSYLRRAYRLETDATVKSQINRDVQRIRAVQRRLATNAARQPAIHKALEQQRVVRPRLPERAAASPPRAGVDVRKGANQ
jgi:tetratricopeptide (TPR) repeat protein